MGQIAIYLPAVYYSCFFRIVENSENLDAEYSAQIIKFKLIS